MITAKQPKEVPEQILKTLKKVTKKRRNTDYMEKKKKKQSVSTTMKVSCFGVCSCLLTTKLSVQVTNSNEQRLPLKKRHYHLVSNNVEGHKAEAEKSNEIEKEDKVEEEKPKPEKRDKMIEKENKVMAKCQTATPRNHLNNNEYEVKVSVIINLKV